ncbi:MAG: RNA-binding protein [Deltaproteobacteria bacterium]|nr:RNA-binding protein [Deltaproteobacteria bacterium]
MPKKLFVGNLPYSAGDADLREHFEQFGQVISARVIMDRQTGRSRGFGFVEMEDNEAMAVLETANGSQMSGRPLRVNEALERPRY